jgi:AH receptor-interacting protein
MELLIGKQFKLPVLEEFVKTMRVGEVSSFHAIGTLTVNYPFFSKQYRAFVKSKTGDHKHEGNSKGQHHCCAIQMTQGTGHEDLDLLTHKPRRMEFLIELLDVHQPEDYEKEVWQMDDTDKVESVPKLKESGNRLYKEGKIEEASALYGKAIYLLEQLQLKEKPGEEEWKELEGQKLPLLSNFAQCRLTLKDYYSCIKHTTEILEKDPKNIKAFFRRGKSHAAVFNFEEAKRDFDQVKELDPTMTSAVEKEVKIMNQVRQRKTQQEKELFGGKLFNVPAGW